MNQAQGNILLLCTVSKWVVIVRPKKARMLLNLSDQFVCPSLKVLDFNEKKLHWASIVYGITPPIAEILFVRNVRALVVCGFLIKKLKKKYAENRNMIVGVV